MAFTIRKCLRMFPRHVTENAAIWGVLAGASGLHLESAG